MKAILELLKTERAARRFFLVHAQSALGTGAGYVALLLLAYERFRSPWAITAVLLAEFLPAMLLGPIFGAAADRWSRKRLLVAADLVRAGAFLGLVLVDGFAATFALALLAGAGNAMFNPTVMASLPGLVSRERFPAATSLYGTIEELGYMAGPALAGAAFVVLAPSAMLLANGITFMASAVVLATLAFGAVPAREKEERGSLLASVREGAAAARRASGTLTLLTSSVSCVAFLGMVNVGELLLAREELGASDTQFSILVTAMGLGVAGGTLLGAEGGVPARLKRRYLAGLLLVAGALLACGAAPSFLVALPAFTALGIGNGLAVVHERLLLQSTLSDDVMGRVFGLRSSLVAFAFGGSFLLAGAAAALLGPRPLFLLAGAGALVAWSAASVALRGAWREAAAPAAAEVPAGAAPALG
ncbi:MAG TPA: MFS transporter [Thermoleophilaceae bacterium]|jgi:MFS family permease